ncbi:MAG: hypothetical protein ACOCZ7_03250 [Armatimonadota bacterium]
MRTTLVLLLVVLCAATAPAQVSPADTVPLDHWAYDAFALLNDVTDDTLSSSYWDGAFAAGAITRHQCAIGVMQTLNALLNSDVTAETPDVEGYAWAWAELAAEFLPEVITAGEPASYLAPAAVEPPWPAQRPDEALPTNLAIRDLRSVPHDHWLYPEAQRVLWAAAELEHPEVLSKTISPADSVPFDDWAYQSLNRLAPFAYHGRDISFERSLARYEFAMLAHIALCKLGEIEEPNAAERDLAVTWALLALEFWPEFIRIDEDVPGQTQMPEYRTIEEGPPVVRDIRSVPADHWLHPMLTRVLRIANRNG